jgi:tetratricopeptide (TPR) repeat protein
MCRGELEPARSAAELFLGLATAAGSIPATVVGHRLLGMVQFGEGCARDAQEQLTTSLRLYQHDRDEATTHIFGQNTQVHSGSLLSLVLFCLGHIEESIKTGIEALESADHLLHPQSAQKLIGLAERHHLGPFRLLGSAFSAWALCQDGRLAEGTQLLSEAVDSLEAIEFRLSLPAHLGNLAYFLLLNDKPEQAKARCSQAIELIQKGADRWFEPELHRIDALISKELDPNNLAVIEAKCRRSIESARYLHFTPFEYSALKTTKDLLGGTPELERNLLSMSEFGDRYEKAAHLIGELWRN